VKRVTFLILAALFIAGATAFARPVHVAPAHGASRIIPEDERLPAWVTTPEDLATLAGFESMTFDIRVHSLLPLISETERLLAKGHWRVCVPSNLTDTPEQKVGLKFKYFYRNEQCILPAIKHMGDWFPDFVQVSPREQSLAMTAIDQLRRILAVEYENKPLVPPVEIPSPIAATQPAAPDIP